MQPLDQALNRAVETISKFGADEELVRLAVSSAMTKAVLHTKEECLNQIISEESYPGDNTKLIEKIHEVLPTSSYSTDLVSSAENTDSTLHSAVMGRTKDGMAPKTSN